MDWTVYFAKHTIQKNSEDSMGDGELEPPNPPLGTPVVYCFVVKMPSDSHLVNKTLNF